MYLVASSAPWNLPILAVSGVAWLLIHPTGRCISERLAPCITTPPPVWSLGHFSSGDGRFVDGLELTPAAVPEPASVVLLGTLIAALAGVARKVKMNRSAVAAPASTAQESA